MQLTVIGPGLIGGSMALDLRRNGFVGHVVGVESNPVHAAQALEAGLVDQVLPLEEAVANSHLIVVAIPVDHLARVLPMVLDLMHPDQVLMDVGSTKAAALAAVEHHALRRRFVATHPMAGTEYSGPGAARNNLFEGKCCVLTNVKDSDPDALALVEKLYASLHMHLAYLDAQAHDLHVAYVSHISHIASFALALTVLEKEQDEAQIFELASSGFNSTVRLAKSHPDTWVPIFQQNRDHILDVLDTYINTVSKFRTLLIKNDFSTFHSLIKQANEIKRILDPA